MSSCRVGEGIQRHAQLPHGPSGASGVEVADAFHHSENAGTRLIARGTARPMGMRP